MANPLTYTCKVFLNLCELLQLLFERKPVTFIIHEPFTAGWTEAFLAVDICVFFLKVEHFYLGIIQIFIVKLGLYVTWNLRATKVSTKSKRNWFYFHGLRLNKISISNHSIWLKALSYVRNVGSNDKSQTTTNNQMVK